MSLRNSYRVTASYRDGESAVHNLQFSGLLKELHEATDFAAEDNNGNIRMPDRKVYSGSMEDNCNLAL